MKNNKGFTVVELLVTFSLTMIIVIFLMQIIIVLKDIYVSNDVKTKLLNKQSILSYKINQEFITKRLDSSTKCGSNCINFIFYDGTTTKLEIDKEKKTITFGDYKTELISGSEFGNIEVTSNIAVVNNPSFNNAILNINIPIYNKLFRNKNYGVNVNLQYNTSYTNVANIIFDNQNSLSGYIMIKGNRNMTISNNTEYVDPGYVYFDSDGVSYSSSTLVEVNNSFDSLELPYSSGTYVVNYKLKDSEGNVVQSLERYVTVE